MLNTQDEERNFKSCQGKKKIHHTQGTVMKMRDDFPIENNGGQETME